MPEVKKLTVAVVSFFPDFGLLQRVYDSLGRESGLYNVIVDNGNQKEVQIFSKKNEIKYLKTERNLGFGAAHNQAIQKFAPKSTYYLILNPDVIVHQGCLEKMISFMDQNPNVVLTVPKVLNPDGTIQRVHKRLPTLFIMIGRRFLPKHLPKWFPGPFKEYELRDLNLDLPHEIPSVSGCFMLFRSEALLKLGGFDERYFMYQEDIDLSRRAWSVGKVVYLPHAKITHYWARGSHRNFKLMWYNVVSALKYFLKWGLKIDIHPKPYKEE